MNTNDRERTVARLKKMAWLLDNSIPLPGLKFRIGLDPLIGLLPFFGDALGALISLYIVAAGARSGLPRSIVLHMGFNVAVEVLIGAVPLIGDLFDMTWKANARNVRLMENYLAAPGKSVASSLFLLWAVVLALGLLIAGLLYLGLAVAAALGSALMQ